MDRSFTPEQFLEWAKTKDPKEGYQYCDPWACPVAQFAKETGRYKRPAVAPGVVEEENLASRTRKNIFTNPFNFSMTIEHAVNPICVDNIQHTFGGIVSRLERMLAA